MIKLKAGNSCEKCGKKEYLNSHHIFSRNNFSVRWDERNGCCLCAGHHTLCNDSAHKSPIEFVEWIKDRRGESWYKILRMSAGTTQKHDYKLLKLYLDTEIKRLTNNL